MWFILFVELVVRAQQMFLCRAPALQILHVAARFFRVSIGKVHFLLWVLLQIE